MQPVLGNQRLFALSFSEEGNIRPGLRAAEPAELHDCAKHIPALIKIR